MNKSFRNIKRTKKFAILIIGICIIGMIIGYSSERFRTIPDLRWVYQYGKMISMILFLGSLLWSLINTKMMITESKSDWKKNLIWIIISALPILYTVIMMTFGTVTVE